MPRALLRPPAHRNPQLARPNLDRAPRGRMAGAMAETHHPFLPLALRIAAMAALGTMAMLVKLSAEAGVHLIETLFWRQALAIPMILAWVLATRRYDVLKTKRPKAQALRGIYGLIGMFLNFGAITLLPLAEATTLSFTSPIFAVLLSILLLHEKIGAWRIAAVVLGFAGVLIIAQPGGDHLPLFGAAIGLGGAFMIALISIQIADLGRTEHPFTIVLWFATMSTVVLLVPVFILGHAHTTYEWMLLISTGVIGSIGQFLLTASLRFGKVASVIVMDYSALIWATLYGWLIWQVLPPASTWIGAPLIIGAGAVIAWRERVLHKRPRAAEPIGIDPV
jgi:drug/metabolite transporter (DMT)-like permease